MRRIFLVVSILGFLLSCGGEDEPFAFTSDVKVNPTRTKGSVVGEVQTFLGDPLAGVRVSVAHSGGMRSDTTDEDGRFSLRDLPAGSVLQVRFEAEGFVSAHVETRIPNEAGEAPLDGALALIGPVALLPSDGRLVLEILDKGGSPLEPPSGACRLRGAWLDRWDGYEEPSGELVVAARFADGRMICEGLPSLSILAALGRSVAYVYAPIDLDGDGIPEYRGGGGEVETRTLVESGRTMEPVLAEPWEEAREFEIVATNAPHLQGGEADHGLVPADGAMEILFSHPIVFHHAKVHVAFDEERALAFEVAIEGGYLRLLPGGDSWPEGALIHFDLLVAPTSEPTAVERVDGLFLTTAETEPTMRAHFVDEGPVPNGLLDPGEILVIELSQVVREDSGMIAFQVNRDLDGDGRVGNAAGELGSDRPFTHAYAQPGMRDGGLASTFHALVPTPLPVGAEIVLFLDSPNGTPLGTVRTPFFTGELRAELEAVEEAP